jgi:biotin-(acetyl-CoA carboxylase) ligase
MSTPAKPEPPDFDEDFLQAIAQWREQHKIKPDDAILLLLDLFRIHQTHWDAIRHRQMPSLDEFRQDIATLTEAVKVLKEKAVKEVQSVDLATAILAALGAALAGFILGKSI